MSTYTDSTHLVSDSIQELHEFAAKIGLKRHYYEGVKKKHPHYDLKNQNKALLICDITKKTFLQKSQDAGARTVRPRELLLISKKMPALTPTKQVIVAILPRLPSTCQVMVKGEIYNVQFVNFFATYGQYEFIHADHTKSKIKTELEVKELILAKRILMLDAQVKCIIFCRKQEKEQFYSI